MDNSITVIVFIIYHGHRPIGLNREGNFHMQKKCANLMHKNSFRETNLYIILIKCSVSLQNIRETARLRPYNPTLKRLGQGVERPPRFGEVYANFCRWRVLPGHRNGFLRPLISVL
jgi:hypothetical protein